MKTTLLILLFLPFHFIGQDITGLWTGHLQTGSSKAHYEVVISKEKDQFVGYALTIFLIDGKENLGVKLIRLKNKDGNILLEDGELIYNNYITPPKRSKLLSQLLVNGGDSSLIMNGTFSTRSLDQRDRTTYQGVIQLKKQKSFKETKLLPRLEELNLLATLSFMQPMLKTDDVGIAKTEVKTDKPKEKESEIIVSAKPVLKPPHGNRVAIAEPIKERTITKSEKLPPATNDKGDVAIATQTKPLTQEQFDENGDLILSKPLRKQNANNKASINSKIIKDSSTTLVAKQTPVIEKIDNKIIESKKETIAVEPKTTVNLAAAAVAQRKTEIIRNMTFTGDSLVLSLYDNGFVDGDTVSVLLNGRVIIAKKGLSEQVIRETIFITPQMGDSLQLVMYAENLGSVPPNTGLLIIQHGMEREEVRFAGDLQKSSGIILRRRR